MKSLLLLASLLVSSNVLAAKLEIIKDHSKIAFDINYMLMTTVDGTFKNYKGEFIINDAEDTLTDIEVTVEGKTVDTNDKKRDFHLRGHEFFFVAKYPQITFKANGPVKIKAGESFKVDGTLTMRGISKPMTLEGEYKGKHKDPWDKDNYFFTLKGSLARKDYGIEWNKVMDNGGLLIGENVNISIVVQAQVKGAKTPFSTHMVPQTKGIKERKELERGQIKELSTSTEIEKKEN